MIGSNYLLDTSIISTWIKGEDFVVSQINDAADIYIPIIAIGEMYYGAQFSVRKFETIKGIYMK